MREKTHFRNCPTCSKEIGHTRASTRDAFIALGRQCQSCANRINQTGITRSAEHRVNIGAGRKAYKKSITDATTKMYGDKVKRKQLDLKKWGKEVQERDDYQCNCCGKEKTTPYSMNAHHIVPKEYFPELAHDLSNGITLCSSCHRGLHYDIERLTLAGIKLNAEGFREHYNIYMSNHSFLRPFIPSSVLDIELRSVSYLMQQTA